jgi:NTE family protein
MPAGSGMTVRVGRRRQLRRRPLCPLDVSPYDFTRAGELIDRAAASTRQWIDGGGLARHEIPHQLRQHLH